MPSKMNTQKHRQNDEKSAAKKTAQKHGGFRCKNRLQKPR